MLKKEFARKLAERGYTHKDAKIIVDDFIHTLFDCLIKGEKVKFAGLGTFEVVERASHVGTNPATHERLTVNSYKMPKFTAGKLLVASVRNSNNNSQ